jgi:hypothetical protein
MDKKKCLQLSLSLVLPCIGLALDLFYPDVLAALCTARGMTGGMSERTRSSDLQDYKFAPELKIDGYGYRRWQNWGDYQELRRYA